MCPNRRSFGMAMTVSTDARSSSSPPLGLHGSPFAPRTGKGFVTTAIVSAPSSLARDATTGAGAGSRPATQAGRHEHHVGAAERADELLGVLEGSLAADVGIRAGAETARHLGPDLQSDRRLVLGQRLSVRVDDDEVDASDPSGHHPADRVAPAPADTDDLDPSAGPNRVLQRESEIPV